MLKRLPLFYSVTFLFWASIYVYVPYVTPYAEYMEADLRFIGLIAGAYGFVQMVLRFPLGILSDRLRKRKVFVLMGLLFAALSGLIVFIMPSPAALLISRSLAGVTAATWVTLTIMGASYYRPEETIKSIGLLNAANGFGRMAALMAGGILAETLGLSYVFLIGGIIAFTGFLLGFGMIEKKPEIKPGSTPSISALFDVAKNSQLLSASILAVICMFIQFATAFGFVPIVAAHMGASNMQLGLLGMVSTLPALFVSPLMARVVSRIGVLYSLSICFLLAGIGTVLVAFSQILLHLFVVQIIASIGLAGLMTVLMGLSIRDIAGEKRATAMGFFQAVYGLGMFLGPFVMGWISHGFGFAGGFIFTGIVAMAGILMTFIFIKRGYLQS